MEKVESRLGTSVGVILNYKTWCWGSPSELKIILKIYTNKEGFLKICIVYFVLLILKTAPDSEKLLFF